MCFPALAAGISAIGSVIGGIQAASASRAQAAADDVQARNTFQQGEYQAGRVQDQVNQTIGTQIASVSGSGVTLDGSPSSVIGSTASEGALDTGAIRWGARANAQMLEFQAKQERSQANGQMIGGILGGVGALAGGLDPSKFTKLGNPFGNATKYRPTFNGAAV